MTAAVCGSAPSTRTTTGCSSSPKSACSAYCRCWPPFTGSAASSARPGHPEAMPLAGLLLLFGAHACFDLLCWFTPLLTVLALVVAALAAFTEQSSAVRASAG